MQTNSTDIENKWHIATPEKTYKNHGRPPNSEAKNASEVAAKETVDICKEYDLLDTRSPKGNDQSGSSGEEAKSRQKEETDHAKATFLEIAQIAASKETAKAAKGTATSKAGKGGTQHKMYIHLKLIDDEIQEEDQRIISWADAVLPEEESELQDKPIMPEEQQRQKAQLEGLISTLAILKQSERGKEHILLFEDSIVSLTKDIAENRKTTL